MSLSASLTRGGGTVFEGPFRATPDPALGRHYGAVVDALESGDELAPSVDAPPRAACHEGNETAFLDVPVVELTV